MKARIDWISLTIGSVRPTQGTTLVVMQFSGGSQLFNAINQLRVRTMDSHGADTKPIVGRESLQQFNEAGRRPSPYYDRIVDGMEELVKFTLLTRGVSSYLTDRYSERKEALKKPAASTST